MISTRINVDKALAQLDLLALDPRKKRRLLRGAGRKVRKQSRQRLREQKGLNGRKWQARSSGRKVKMLRRLGRHLQVHTSSENAQVTFANKRVGQVARAHQEGVTQRMDAATAKQAYGKPDYKGGASKSQAKALLENGYKIRRNKGKGWKRPSQKWIRENLTLGQAGLILRILRDSQAKKDWQIKLPQRSFLGQTEQEQIELSTFMLTEAVRLS